MSPTVWRYLAVLLAVLGGLLAERAATLVAHHGNAPAVLLAILALLCIAASLWNVRK